MDRYLLSIWNITIYKLSDSLINFDKTITLLKPKNSWDFLINQLIDNNIF